MKQYDKSDVSMPLYEFQYMYSEYCSKNGYVEIQQLETKGRRTFKAFNMEILSQEGRLEHAYVNMRFKTFKEKAEV